VPRLPAPGRASAARGPYAPARVQAIEQGQPRRPARAARAGRDKSGIELLRQTHGAASGWQGARTGAQAAQAAPLTVASLSAGVAAVWARANAPPGDGVAAEPARPLLPAAAAGGVPGTGGAPARTLAATAGAAPGAAHAPARPAPPAAAAGPAPGSGPARPLPAAARPGWGAGPGCARALAAAAGLGTLGGASAPAGPQLVGAAVNVGAPAASARALPAAAGPSACGGNVNSPPAAAGTCLATSCTAGGRRPLAGPAPDKGAARPPGGRLGTSAWRTKPAARRPLNRQSSCCSAWQQAQPSGEQRRPPAHPWAMRG